MFTISILFYNNEFFYFQAFASERGFGILSEILYNLLQLVSVSNQQLKSPVSHII